MTSAYEPQPFTLPLPPDFEDEEPADVLVRAAAMCGAAEQIVKLCVDSGQPVPTPTPDEREHSLAAFEGGVAVFGKEVSTTATAVHLTALLNEYDMQVVMNAQQLRNFVTNHLLELAATGEKEASRLRALEMIGKISDVSLFDEKTTIIVEHMTTEDVKTKLREKINRLRSVVVQPVTDVEFTHQE